MAELESHTVTEEERLYLKEKEIVQNDESQGISQMSVVLQRLSLQSFAHCKSP